MKLRVHGSSLRLRLTQEEVGRLAAGGTVESTTPMAGGALVCRAIPDAHVSHLEAVLESGFIRVSVPEEGLAEWAASEVEGIYSDQPVNGGAATLNLALEKDYACLHKTAGNEGTFPNPAASKKKHH